MNIQCSQKALADAVATVERAVATTDTVAVLKGILLTTKANQLVLSSSNLELSIRTAIDCQVTKQGSLVLPGKLLASIIRKLPDETVIFQLHEDSRQVEITAGQAEFSIHYMDGSDFPEFPELRDKLCTLTVDNLHRLIKNTIFATSHDESRPYLNGVLLELGPESITFVATDSNRLATYRVDQKTNSSEPVRAIVPSKTLQDLYRSLGQDSKRSVDLYRVDQQLAFCFDSTLFITRLIEGSFPNYQSVIPGEQPIKIQVKTASLLAAIDRAALIDQKGSQPIVIEVSDGTLEVKTAASEMGFACEQMPVEHQGINGQAAFSPKFMMDMLRATDTNYVSFEFNTDLRQAVLKPAASGEQLYVIMPIRL